MPELPEVQTVVNHLAKEICGRTFYDCWTASGKMVSRNFKTELVNRKILTVSRRAKMIVVKLSDEKYLLVHLKMTGQLIFVGRKKIAGGGHPIFSAAFNLARPNKFTRIILNFKDGSRLLFHDIRKFGWMKIVTGNQYSAISNKYGVEPLAAEFTLKKFKEILARRPNLKIKQLLMTQELIAGIGNIYADESLFGAKIKPARPAKTLTNGEVGGLHRLIVKKLKEAIKLGGTSINTFVSSSGQRGEFVNKLKVYGRGGEKCRRCQAILKKTKIAGRGTVFCDECQK